MLNTANINTSTTARTETARIDREALRTTCRRWRKSSPGRSSISALRPIVATATRLVYGAQKSGKSPRHCIWSVCK